MAQDHVEDLLAEWHDADPDRGALVARLRQLVLAVDPRITEAVKYGGILFSAGAPFCGIFSYTRHVSLEFSRGAELDDVHQVLEGEGAKRRHIKIVDGNDLFKKNVKAYVAMALPGKPAKTATTAAAAAAGRPARGATRRSPR